MTKAESKAASILGRKGGQSKSEAKVQASRDNGKLGGRPTRCNCGHMQVAHIAGVCGVCECAEFKRSIIAITREHYKLRRARRKLRNAINRLNYHGIGYPHSDPGDSAAIWLMHDALVAIGNDIFELIQES